MANKIAKQVQILARYTHKCNGVPTGLVSYKVRSSNGKNEYCTTLLHGQAVGCSCPATKPCYHMNQLQVIEQARRAEAAHKAFAAAQAIVAQPAIQPVQAEQAIVEVTPEQIEALIQDHELPLIGLLKHFTPAAKVATAQLVAATKSTIDYGTRGNLHSAKGFSVLRT